jgi:hypothetical protein
VSRSQFNLRWPVDELQEVKDEAQRYGISTAALIRINCIHAREARERERLIREIYPQRGTERTGITSG